MNTETQKYFEYDRENLIQFLGLTDPDQITQINKSYQFTVYDGEMVYIVLDNTTQGEYDLVNIDSIEEAIDQLEKWKVIKKEKQMKYIHINRASGNVFITIDPEEFVSHYHNKIEFETENQVLTHLHEFINDYHSIVKNRSLSVDFDNLTNYTDNFIVTIKELEKLDSNNLVRLLESM